jgi:hypothetical protein
MGFGHAYFATFILLKTLEKIDKRKNFLQPIKSFLAHIAVLVIFLKIIHLYKFIRLRKIRALK